MRQKGGCKMNSCCTFISKERRTDPAQYHEYKQNQTTVNNMTLWKNDEGNAAAVLIAEPGIKNAVLVTAEVTDENGNPTSEIIIKAEFQKFVKTYTGNNWIPEPRPFQPPEPPAGDRSLSADVILGPEIEEGLMAETDHTLLQPIWITVSVSKDAAPGIYIGKINVLPGNGETLTLVQNIRVLNLELGSGEDYYLNLWQYPYASAAYYQVPPFSKEHLAIVKNEMKPYIKAGGKTGTASIVEEPWYHQTWCDYPSMIKWIKKDGTWQFDYTDFDKWAAFLLKEIKVSYIECYSIVPWENILRYTEDGAEKMQKAAPGTKPWEDAWTPFLKDFAKHLDQKGWFEHIIIAMDERPEAEMEAALNLLGSIRNRNGNSFKTGGAVEKYNKKLWDRLFTVTPHISSICEEKIPLNLFRAKAEERRKQGKLTSIYSMIGDYPGIFSMSDPGEAAWTIWYAEFCGTDGFLKWAYDAWCENPLEDNSHCYFEAGDMFLVYPGEYCGERTAVRSSPRYQMMTEAVRDIRKLRQLRQEYSRQARRIDELLNSVKSYYGLGVSNGIGTAGFKTADEETKEALAGEVRRLHQAVVELAEVCACAEKLEKEQFMERVGLPEEGIKCVLNYAMDENTYQSWRVLFYENETEFFRKIDEQSEKEPLLLYLYVRFAVDLYTKYTEKGIPDKIYYDTFSDFTIWFSHCRRQKNVVGLTEENWLKLHLKMKLFRLGRLQFETDEKEGRIHVHIPEGESLSPEACDEAFSQAEDFFDDSYTSFDCESWLLSPVLAELLDERNRIIQFQKRFQITRVDRDARQAEEKVFGEIREDKSSYPENTSLQRALKRYLLTGKNPGTGFGVVPRHGK